MRQKHSIVRKVPGKGTEPRSVDSRVQAGRHLHPQFLALAQEPVAEFAPHHQGVGDGLPAQSGDDLLHAGAGALAVQAALDVERARHRLGLFQAGIVDPFEKILDEPAHVAEVLGGAHDHRVRGQYVSRLRLQGFAHDQPDVLEDIVGRTPDHRVTQPGAVVGGAVGDDQKRGQDLGIRQGFIRATRRGSRSPFRLPGVRACDSATASRPDCPRGTSPPDSLPAGSARYP